MAQTGPAKEMPINLFKGRESAEKQSSDIDASSPSVEEPSDASDLETPQLLRDQLENADPARQKKLMAAALRPRPIRAIFVDLQSAMHESARAPVDEEDYRVVLLQWVIRDTSTTGDPTTQDDGSDKWHAQSTMTCPKCKAVVKVGFGGHSNYAQHKTSCDKTQAKPAPKKPVHASLSNFFFKADKAPVLVPPTVAAPAPVQGPTFDTVSAPQGTGPEPAREVNPGCQPFIA
ncbi:hypothetical protein B0H13DRAFT_2394507 [Mycena leptocephala]|nr:hypothetical protein B0H13DRAFT_2394507 [Mycena leptocephala]